MTALFFKSILQVSRLLTSGQISSVELTKQMLERIRILDPALNAYIRVLDKEAINQAQKADDNMIRGKVTGPLQGIPIAIKDIFETKGSVTTAGSKVLSQWKPVRDAIVIRKLKQAGAVIIGKTNLHEFAMGATTENPYYGPTRNPWNLKKIPGGSSGGSAAAVASGMCYGALGTDTGGSIRLPSSLCGVVGLKPTYDLVDRTGCIPLSWSLDHIGPIGRTIDDCALVLRTIADQRKVEHQNLDLSLDNLGTINSHSVTIGICKEYFFEKMEPGIKLVIDKAIDDLEETGFHFTEIKVPGIRDGLEAQKIISKSEAYAFHQKAFELHPDLFGDDVRFRLESGSKVKASDYINAQRVRRLFVTNMKHAMGECDVLLTPTNVINPFDIGQRGAKESINNIFDLGRTPIGNLLGFPALTVPCGFSTLMLPVGMQLIGKPYSEDLLLSIGKLYEDDHDWIQYFEKNKAYMNVRQ